MGDYTGNKRCIVFDIDGTLADCEHRRHFVANRPKDFNAFFEAMDNDATVPHMLGIHNLHFLHDWEIVYCTGRPEMYRGRTRIWLHRHGFMGNDLSLKGLGRLNALHMRPDERRNDPDYEIKQDMFDLLTKEHGYTIEMVFDDRQQVVDMWRRNGVPCLQVAEGNF